jgi:hypothetical protein
MHGEGPLPRWTMPSQTIMRVSASDGRETWMYQFHPMEWRRAVRRIIRDTHAGKISEEAAGGLLHMISEGVDAD